MKEQSSVPQHPEFIIIFKNANFDKWNYFVALAYTYNIPQSSLAQSGLIASQI